MITKKKQQTSKSNGRENFLCPFTDVYITQDYGVGSHKGTKAYDIRGAKKGVRYPYYAPCTCKLIWSDRANGQGLWQSVAKVNFANGRVDYATFMTAHDETFDARIGQIVPQGHQLGNMGSKAGGGARSTGVHCHIEIAQAKYTISNWYKNKYGIWCFPKEYSLEDSCYINDTKIIKGLNKKWKYIPKNKKVSYYKKYTGKSGSIADALKSMNIDNSFTHRKKIAAANGIKNYVGSPKQNIQMLDKLKKGVLIVA